MLTVRNEVAKVMFLHLSVSHSVHRGGCLSACWDTTPPEQAPPPDQAPPRTRPLLEPGTPQAQAPQGQAPPGTRHPPGPDTPLQQTATVMDGTHPTGMHSCRIDVWLQLVKIV